jgi:PQQ-dependent catabolism-associated CXXCW motif protein
VHAALFLCLALAVVANAAPALAQVPHAEREDFGVPPTAALRLAEHSAPTPLEIPGARPIFTAELRRRLQAPPQERPLLFDVLGADNAHLSLPGAIWLPGAGRGDSFDDEVQARLAQLLEVATRDDRARELVFFCASTHCWLSYNAALRAARLGYPGVRWYRGGIEAWGASGGATSEPRLAWPYR